MQATSKQIEYAQSIAEELGLDLPDERTMEKYSEFITLYKDMFYSQRRRRMGGYAEMFDRIDRYKI